MKKYLLLMLIAASNLHAETFNVSTTAELRVALSTAATNGEDDTIILADGTYKTTDDGEGTLIYFSNEANRVTLQGSSAENVILDGDNLHQILNHQSTESTTLVLNNLKFMNGTASQGGAVYTIARIDVNGSVFISNQSSSGGGFYSEKSATVRDSIFKNNEAQDQGGGFMSPYMVYLFDSHLSTNSASKGGGFASGGSSIVRNSTFMENTSTSEAGFWAVSTTVDNSSFINNTGAGFGVEKRITVSNSTFSGNSGTAVRTLGRYYSDIGEVNITNCIFTNNSSAIYQGINSYNDSVYRVRVANSLLANNSSGIKVIEGTGHSIVNSIFINNDIDITGYSDAIIKSLNNNYIDLSTVNAQNFASDNIYDGVTLGFIDQVNNDYHLTDSSALIDAGTINIEGVVVPEADMDGNTRISGGAIDIGPYEFSSTRPTINTVTFTGTAKEQNELTFTTDYTLADGREVTEVLYDFMNDGNYTSLNTYTYNTVGSYTINVKVTDSEGEFSTTTTTVTIAELPFSEMTYEQKLIKAILPEYYDLLISEIDIEKSKSFSSGKHYVQNNLTEFSLVTEAAQATAVAASNTSGIATGKQYVQDNLTEFSLVTEAAQATAVAAATTTGITDGENNVINNPVTYGLNIVVGLSKEGIAQLPSGWKMISIPEDVTDLSVFDDAKIVWFFNNETQAWTGYSSNTNTVQQMEDKNIGIITSLSTGDGVFIEM